MFLILKLIRFEWSNFLSISLCIASILLPVLIIFGLKNGTVRVLENRILQNPASLQVVVENSRDFTVRDIALIGSWDECRYVVANSRRLALDGHCAASTDDEGYSSQKMESMQRAIFIASSRGDPLLSLSSILAPEERQAVITEQLAKDISLGLGDYIDIWLWRIDGSQKKWRKCRQKITGIINSGKQQHIVYLHPDFIAQVEHFKENKASKLFGENETSYKLKANYEGIIISCPAGTSILDFQQELNYAFANHFEHKEIFDSEASTPHGSPTNSIVFYDNLALLDNESFDDLMLLLPHASLQMRGWNSAISISLENQEKRLKLYPNYHLAKSESLHIYGPKFASDLGSEMIKLYGHSNYSELITRISAQKYDEFYYCDPLSHAILSRMKNQSLRYNSESREMTALARSYSSIRCYANTIEDAPRLAEKMMQQFGYPAQVNSREIQHVLKIKEIFNQIFYHIAILCAAGAALSLLLNLLNNLERRMKDYSLLRLIGLRQVQLILLSFIESILILTASLMMAWGFFSLFKHLADQWMRDELMPGESYCSIQPQDLAFGLMISLLILMIVSLITSLKLYRITPAQSIRSIS